MIARLMSFGAHTGFPGARILVVTMCMKNLSSLFALLLSLAAHSDVDVGHSIMNSQLVGRIPSRFLFLMGKFHLKNSQTAFCCTATVDLVLQC